MLYKPDIDVYPVRWTSRVYDSSPIINSLLLILNARLRFTGYDTLKISPVSDLCSCMLWLIFYGPCY
jgi:hypothetical protein